MTENEVNNLENKYIVCKECGEEFIFAAGEQRFYLSKNLSDPKRCKQCIRIRKLSIG
ncbi:zinc-ribbon domain containing protein [Chloroflexota bacterium]